MPTWDFQCPECDRVLRDVTHFQCNPEPVWPECCGRRMEMLWDRTTLGVSVFQPYTTCNIHPEGKPLEIRGRSDQRRYENQYGVHVVDDPGLKMRNGELVREQT